MLKRTAHARTRLVERTEVSNKAPEVLSHCPVDTCTAHPEILDLLPDNSKRGRGHRHNTDLSGPSIALNTQLLRGSGGYGCNGGLPGLRAGFVFAVGTMMGSVDQDALLRFWDRC